MLQPSTVASKQNMEKLSISKTFSFITEVTATCDKPIHFNILANFRKN
jgi:hypothetical protein